MAVENDDTLAFFLSTNDFAVDATYTPVGGSATTVSGIYDDPYLAASAGGMVEFTATSPTFLAKTSDFTGATYGASLVVSGKTYAVVEVMPDGTGMTTLMLEEQ